MSKNNKIGLVLCLILAMSLTACGDKKVTQPLIKEELMVSQQANYKTAQVEYKDYFNIKSGKLGLTYLYGESLFWDESNASIREVLVKEDQVVEKGDVLMVFDIDIDEVALESLRLQLTRAKEDLSNGHADRLAAIDKAKEQLENMQDYQIPVAELKIDKMQVECEQFIYQSEYQIKQLEEEIAEMEEDLADNVLVAPFNGVIDKIPTYHIGDKVVKGKELIYMYSTEAYALKVTDGSEHLRYNMDVSIEIGKDMTESYPGKVIVADNILPSALKQGLILIMPTKAVTEEDLALAMRFRSNIRYEASIEELHNILLVDRRAVSKENGKDYVNVLNGDSIQKRYIVTGMNNSESVWVLDGLTEGQTLVLD